MVGPDGGLLRRKGRPAAGRGAPGQGNDGTANDLSYRHGGAACGPGMETHAQQADRGKPGRDQQAPDQLQHPDPRRDQRTDHCRDAVQAAMSRAAICFTLTAIIFAAAEVRAAEVADRESYRLEDYRAPTPATLRGAKAIGTEEAEKIWRSRDASFVDVLAGRPRPRNPQEGMFGRDNPRPDIPGSIWLPDTGYGELSAPMADYFARGLAKATHG